MRFSPETVEKINCGAMEPRNTLKTQNPSGFHARAPKKIEPTNYSEMQNAINWIQSVEDAWGNVLIAPACLAYSFLFFINVITTINVVIIINVVFFTSLTLNIRFTDLKLKC
jgi:hypothetical protein